MRILLCEYFVFQIASPKRNRASKKKHDEVEVDKSVGRAEEKAVTEEAGAKRYLF